LVHEAGNDPVKDNAIVIGLIFFDLSRGRIDPIFGAFREANKIGNRHGGVLVIELYREFPHCRGNISIDLCLQGGGAEHQSGEEFHNFTLRRSWKRLKFHFFANPLPRIP
jgi:hypothetical protein